MMGTALETENVTDRVVEAGVVNEVYRWVRRSGPLCVSQIAADLGLGMATVIAALLRLKERGLLESLEEVRDNQKPLPEELKPWGVPRLKWLFRIRRAFLKLRWFRPRFVNGRLRLRAPQAAQDK